VSLAPPPRSEVRPERSFLLLLACIAALAAYFRFSALGRDGLWLDELWSVRAATRESWAGLLHEVRVDVHPPLYFAMLRIWMSVLGTGEAVLRSLSGVAGIGAVVVVGFLGRRLAGSAAGLAGAALQATAPFAILMDREARANSWMSFLAILGFWLCSAVGLRGWRWFAYLLVAAALPWIHLFGVFAVVAHGIWVASEAHTADGRTKVAHWGAAAALAALSFVPWVPSLRAQGGTFTARQWYALPEGDTLAWLLPDIAGGPGAAAMLVIGVVLVLAGGEQARLARLTAAGVLAQIAIPTALSLTWAPFLRDRNVLALLPVLCLAAGAGYARVRAGWMWVLLVAASFALNYVRSRFTGPREEWREAAQFALERWKPGDGFDANYRWLWDYYVPQIEDGANPEGRTWILRAHDDLEVPRDAADHVVVEKRFVQAYVALVDMRTHEVAVGHDLGPPVWEKDTLHFYWGFRAQSAVVPTAGRCAIGVEAWGDEAGGVPAQIELAFVPPAGAPIASSVALSAERTLVWGDVVTLEGPAAIAITFVNDGTATDANGATADRNAYVGRVLWRCEAD
jgi:hypothetical protein